MDTKNILISKTFLAAALAAACGAAQAKWGWVIPPEYQAAVLMPLLMVALRAITKTPVTVRPAKKV